MSFSPDSLVESEVVSSGSEVIERIRLSDEAKRKKAMSQEDLVQYYQHSAERGDTQAQVRQTCDHTAWAHSC